VGVIKNTSQLVLIGFVFYLIYQFFALIERVIRRAVTSKKG